MWLPLADEGIEIGDLVETVGLGLERERFVATIAEMSYEASESRIVYRLCRGAVNDDRLYERDELKVLTDKTKLMPGTTLHPRPQWIEAFRGDALSGDYLHFAADVESDDGTDQ